MIIFKKTKLHRDATLADGWSKSRPAPVESRDRLKPFFSQSVFSSQCLAFSAL